MTYTGENKIRKQQIIDRIKYLIEYKDGDFSGGKCNNCNCCGGTNLNSDYRYNIIQRIRDILNENPYIYIGGVLPSLSEFKKEYLRKNPNSDQMEAFREYEKLKKEEEQKKVVLSRDEFYKYLISYQPKKLNKEEINTLKSKIPEKDDYDKEIIKYSSYNTLCNKNNTKKLKNLVKFQNALYEKRNDKKIRGALKTLGIKPPRGKLKIPFQERCEIMNKYKKLISKKRKVVNKKSPWVEFIKIFKEKYRPDLKGPELFKEASIEYKKFKNSDDFKNFYEKVKTR